MDLEWLQKFSGGLDLIPVLIAIAGLYSIRKLPHAHRVETKLAYTLAMICFISLPIAQTSWVVAVIQGIPFLGTLMDNVWTIYNFASLTCILICLHTMEPRQRQYDNDNDTI